MPELLRRLLGPRNFARWRFRRVHGYALDLDSPRTLSEKIIWIMLHCDLGPLAPFVDKAGVPAFVASRVGERYLVPSYGVYERWGDIQFAQLPNEFVMRATHASGFNILVRDKGRHDWDTARRKMERWLTIDYGLDHDEDCYRGIQPRIIVNRMLKDPDGDLRDYKFYCSDGEVMGLHVDVQRYGAHAYRVYDADWNEFEKEPGGRSAEAPPIERPQRFDEMLDVCRRLSRGFFFVRVDLYCTGEAVYFGELTFTPGGGLSPFDPFRSDACFGEPLDVRALQSRPFFQPSE